MRSDDLYRWAVLLVVVACSKPPSPHAVRGEESPDAGREEQHAPEDDAAAPASVTNAEGLAALEGESIQTWQLGDIETSVAIPVGAREKRPVVLGVHGSADHPERVCERWQATLANFAFVVCPRGVPYGRGLAWGAPSVLAERADRAMAALRERYGPYIADGPVTYGGWSLGATLASSVVALRPGTYDRAILVEVGHTRIDAKKTAAGLKVGRTARVIVSCATRRCIGFAKRLEREWAGPGFAINDGGIGRGHLFDPQMFRTLGQTIAKDVEGDPRWTGFAARIAAHDER
jgi:hypothetical protein